MIHNLNEKLRLVIDQSDPSRPALFTLAERVEGESIEFDEETARILHVRLSDTLFGIDFDRWKGQNEKDS